MSYYIAPSFLNKLAIHITKNFLEIPRVRVPLILGIHGRKGEGKSFQCELVFKRMGVEPIHISAGELESPDAGDPARLIRLRYREAAELIRVRGKMTVLVINDLDAGAGRFDSGTQYTVNTQLVNATLMNIADNPTNVQLPGSYDDTPLHRVPILITGNDLSTLYAPLIRDGRMEKFYWEPSRDDRIGIVSGIFGEDGLSRQDIEKLVDTFSDQSIDFFGALRSRLYDEQILQFIQQVGFDRVSSRVVNAKDKPPEFKKPDFSLPRLMEFGNLMRGEQQRVDTMRLGQEYNLSLRNPERQSQPVASPQPVNTPAPQQPQNGQQKGLGNGYAAPSQLSAEIREQLQIIRSGGYRVGVEFADQRHFRTSSWKSESIEASRDGEIENAIASILEQHPGEYVRLIGIDPKAKRRVVETIIQRP